MILYQIKNCWLTIATSPNLLSPKKNYISDLLTGGSPSAASASSDVEILRLVAGLSPAAAAKFVADLNNDIQQDKY